MDLTLDHVPVAWSDLDAISAEFERLGLDPEYGGVHDNGVTHMSVLGFDDHSYIELIAERERGDHGFWPDHIRADAGPAAWCIRVDDIAEECARMIRAGVPTHGPLHGARERDDGIRVEWDRAEFGAAERKLLFPFAIQDRTPLDYRVSPSPSVADGPLRGIGQVVVATADLARDSQRLQRVYHLPRPRRDSVPGLGDVASFPGQPLALVTPTGDGWLASRLDQFPAGPCSVLLEAEDLARAREAYPLGDSRPWPDGEVAFFESEMLGPRLGVIDRREPAGGLDSIPRA